MCVFCFVLFCFVLFLFFFCFFWGGIFGGDCRLFFFFSCFFFCFFLLFFFGGGGWWWLCFFEGFLCCFLFFLVFIESVRVLLILFICFFFIYLFLYFFRSSLIKLRSLNLHTKKNVFSNDCVLVEHNTETDIITPFITSISSVNFSIIFPTQIFFPSPQVQRLYYYNYCF